jgi:hypothetical protein
MEVSNGTASYMPPLHLRLFRNDLDTLPAFFGNQNDIILVHKKPDTLFIEYLNALGFNLPIFLSSANELTTHHKIDTLSPWGWSPAAHKTLSPFSDFLTTEWTKHPMSKWTNDIPSLLSRNTTYNFIKLLAKINDKSYNLLYIPTSNIKIENLRDLQTITNHIQPPILLKTPWSASGRGLFKIRNLNEQPEENAWLKAKLKQQKALYAEQYLKKILDVSFHFFIEEHKITFMGNTFFETDSKNRFTGCYLRMPENPPIDTALISDACKQSSALLLNGLKLLNINSSYQGPLGIDAIFFEKTDNTIKLNPCVEINMRYTMGLLNLFLRKRVHPEKNGKWNITKGEIYNHNELQPQKHLKDGFIFDGNIPLSQPTNQAGYITKMTIF